MRGGRGRRGLTLLEVLLAVALTVLLLSGVMAYFFFVLKVKDDGSRMNREVKLGRALLMRMADEIRQASDIVPGDGIGFRGDRYSLTVVYLRLPEKYAFNEWDPTRSDLPPAQLDLRRVSYNLLWDEENEDPETGDRLCHGVWRAEQRTFDPNPRFVTAAGTADTVDEVMADDAPVIAGPQPEGELFAPEIKYLEFAYFDGAEWQPEWQFSEDPEGAGGVEVEPGKEGAGAGQEALADLMGGKQGGKSKGYALPQAVRVTIGRTPVDPERDTLDLTKLKDLEEEERLLEFHDDRVSLVVPILQADRTLLSSRKYGVSSSIARQEGGAR